MRAQLTTDPKLTLYVRDGCPACRDAEMVLDGVGISYIRLRVSRLCPGTILIWNDAGEMIAKDDEAKIPATPALCVRDRDPALIFCSLEQVIAFCAGRTFHAEKCSTAAPNC